MFYCIFSGKELGENLAKLPVNHNKVIGLVADTTTMNSGIGRKGGSCYWYQQEAKSTCFIVMCRIHSQECIAGRALSHFDAELFGPSKCCDVGTSSTVTSLKTLCFNLRMLCSYVDFWGDVSDAQFTWPEDYTPIDGNPYLSHMTDLQKLYCLLISKKQLSKSEVAKKFVPVGVRWLGFYCSLLHVTLTMDVVISKLENIDTSDLPKTKIGIKDNTIRCLLALKGSPTTRKKIYEYAKVHFICWRKAVTCTGENLFETTVKTSQMYAEVGLNTGLDNAYFTCINRHLYNADPIFMPLSTDKDHMAEVKKILQIGIAEEWQYQPAEFTGRLNYDFTRSELCHLDTATFIAKPAFAKRVFNSPLFKHLDATMKELSEIYGGTDTSLWRNISRLIPGHNQACERLIGDIKLSHDIDTLVTVTEARRERPRIHGNVNKS